MSSILESVEWGESALSLISQCTKIDHGLPAVMHIRHSERPPVTPTSILSAALTDQGKDAAYEMGTRLPADRTYRLFHSASARAIETAEEIHRGLRSIDADAHMGGVFHRLHDDREKFVSYLFQEYKPEMKTARPYFIKWASGHYPPEEIEPSQLFSQRAASVMMKNLEKLEPTGFDIYASHDIWVAPFLFHWFGIMPSEDWPDLLDGFILQLTDERMRVYTSNDMIEAHYPHWWSY
jgi:broad specificity phosphatase PhoE